MTDFLAPLADNWDTLRLLLIVLVAFWLVGALLRLVSHTIADLPRSASACFAIVFLYLLAGVVWCQGGEELLLLRALPFWSQLSDLQGIYRLMQTDFSAFFVELCKLFVMAFVINLGQDVWIRRGQRNIFLWAAMELGVIVTASLANYGVDHLLDTYLPQGFVSWVPIAVLCAVGLLLILALMKLVFQLMNPVLGLLFGFFSGNVAGRTLTKSFLTTLLLGAAVSLTRQLGYGVTLSQLSWPFQVTTPAVLVLALLWYLLWRIFC